MENRHEFVGQSQRASLKRIPKNQIMNMDPTEIDNRDLEIDPLDQLELWTYCISVDVKTYRLKVSGKVAQPLRWL